MTDQELILERIADNLDKIVKLLTKEEPAQTSQPVSPPPVASPTPAADKLLEEPKFTAAQLQTATAPFKAVGQTQMVKDILTSSMSVVGISGLETRASQVTFLRHLKDAAKLIPDSQRDQVFNALTQLGV